jgi:hypothetical protein
MSEERKFSSVPTVYRGFANFGVLYGKGQVNCSTDIKLAAINPYPRLIKFIFLN